MFHLLTAFFFLGVLLAAGTLVVGLIREDGERIASALLRAPVTELRPWNARVRMVSMRPSAPRSAARRAAA